MRTRIGVAALLATGLAILPAAAAQADTADIETTVVSGPAQVQKDTDAAFQFRVLNRGPNAASGQSTKVTISIVGRSTFETRSISAKTLGSGAARGTCTATGTTGAGCDFGNMAVGESILVSVTIHAEGVVGATDLPAIGSLSTGRTDLSDPNAGRKASNPNSNDEVSAPFEIIDPPADGKPPRITRLSISGRTVKITVNEAATLSGSIERRTSGRGARGKPCSTKRKSGPRCTKYVKVGSYKRALPAGATTFKLPTRVKGRKLKPGTYRLRFFLTDAGGARTKNARSVTFRIR